MTAKAAVTIQRYIGAMGEDCSTVPEIARFSELSNEAIASGVDLSQSDLLTFYELLGRFGPADIALRCGNRWRVADLGVVGHAIASCKTLGAALQIAIAHDSGNDTLRKVDFSTAGGEWRLQLQILPSVNESVQRLLCEEWIAGFFSHLTEITGVVRPPARIEFDGDEIEDIAYGRWLPIIPKFRQGCCAITLPTSLLDQPLVFQDGVLLHIIQRYHADYQVEPNYVQRVKRYFVAEEASPSLPRAAAHIGVSSRTLVRRLADEHATFRDLLADHRRSYAIMLARDGRFALKQIAASLGYKSEVGFSHAFAEWTGKTLSQWRRDQGVRREHTAGRTSKI